MGRRADRIERFDLQPGQKIGGKFRVVRYMGGGLQGEVYEVTELQTRIRRAAKLFYPQQNERNQAARAYARKLDRLRSCPIVIQYHHAERIEIQGIPVTCLLSELVDGIVLADFVSARPRRRLPPFKALHLLYSLVCGLEQIHRLHDYHGDLHAWNILVQPRGIFFDVKLVDFYNLGKPTAALRRDDVVDLIHLLYEMTGGRRCYARQPAAIKAICKGLRRDFIRRAFPSVGHLRRHLELSADFDAV